jgi:hypothetical protein
MSHTAELNDRLRRIKIEPVLSPWQRTVHALGGLTEVGYVSATDLLLAVTSTGRGLFDCISGQRVTRDRTPPEEGGWYDETGLLAQGIGPAEPHLVRLAGLHGGGLPRTARDGWSLELVAPAGLFSALSSSHRADAFSSSSSPMAVPRLRRITRFELSGSPTLDAVLSSQYLTH